MAEGSTTRQRSEMSIQKNIQPPMPLVILLPPAEFHQPKHFPGIDTFQARQHTL
jgi:hypothetical protein